MADYRIVTDKGGRKGEYSKQDLTDYTGLYQSESLKKAAKSLNFMDHNIPSAYLKPFISC